MKISEPKDFNSILRNLKARLNGANSTNILGWFQAIEETAESVGLSWVVAALPPRGQLLGSSDALKIVVNIQKAESQGDSVRYLPVNPPAGQTHGVLEILLREVGAQVWFGVTRLDFDRDLYPHSPWETFIKQFAEIAEASLLRLVNESGMKTLSKRSQQDHALLIIAMTTGMLMHQLLNMTRDISIGASALSEANDLGYLKCEAHYSKLIRAVAGSSEQLLELGKDMSNLTRLDARRPCSLLETVNQSAGFFERSSALSNVKLQIDVAPDLAVDVPSSVASLAFANLISNAKDAITKARKGGSIYINAVRAKDYVYCHVTDDGPGIPEEMRNQLFKLGTTTKKHGGGWGLYFVARLLAENGAHIELADAGSNGTRFTIQFPLAKQE